MLFVTNEKKGLIFFYFFSPQINYKLNPLTWNMYSSAHAASEVFFIQPESLKDPYAKLFSSATVGQIKSAADITSMRKTPIYFPAYWLDESGEISDEDAKKYVDNIYGLRKLGLLIQYVVCPIAAVIVALLIVLFVLEEKWIAERKTQVEEFSGIEMKKN